MDRTGRAGVEHNDWNPAVRVDNKCWVYFQYYNPNLRIIYRTVC